MSETPSQPSVTPARRRNGRNGRPAAQKAYASENDVAAIDPARHDRAPRTPQKGAGTDSPMSHTNSKQRTRNGSHNNNNKHRGKSGPHSPESVRPGRVTPPNQSSSMKSISAFAGATFHASPAPSALPLPSFVSRPATESPSLTTKAPREIVQEPSPPTDTEAPTPLRQSSSGVQESPLDFMFRAHRQEKERQRSGSTSSFRPSGLVNESPSVQSPFGSGSVPQPATLPQTARTQARFPGGIDSAELDGTPGRPLGPAFSTPYQERIRAARTNSARSPADLSSHQQRPNFEPEDPTEALKKFLFSGNGTTVSQSVPNGFAPAPPAHQYDRARNIPNAPSPYDSRSNNIQAMENDLRRILKLDLGSPSPSPGTNQRLFS